MSGKNNLKRKIRARSGWAVLMLALFVLLTALLMKVDVRAIGPENSSVGLDRSANADNFSRHVSVIQTDAAGNIPVILQDPEFAIP